MVIAWQGSFKKCQWLSIMNPPVKCVSASDNQCLKKLDCFQCCLGFNRSFGSADAYTVMVHKTCNIGHQSNSGVPTSQDILPFIYTSFPYTQPSSSIFRIYNNDKIKRKCKSIFQQLSTNFKHRSHQYTDFTKYMLSYCSLYCNFMKLGEIYGCHILYRISTF